MSFVNFRVQRYLYCKTVSVFTTGGGGGGGGGAWGEETDDISDHVKHKNNRLKRKKKV